MAGFSAHYGHVPVPSGSNCLQIELSASEKRYSQDPCEICGLILHSNEAKKRRAVRSGSADLEAHATLGGWLRVGC